MRADMFKVIVERPRKWKSGDRTGAQRRRDFDGEPQLGMRAGYGSRALNENLNPLRRYLRAQVGRPWSKVYSEIASNIDRRSTVQQHIYQHIEDFVAIQVEWQNGQLVDLAGGLWSWHSSVLRQEMYVDPRTGLLRANRNYRDWRRISRDRAAEERAKADARRRTLDDLTQLHLLDGEWYEVQLARFPVGANTDARCFDVVMKEAIPRDHWRYSGERFWHYGAHDVYAVSKRQLSWREKRRHGLTSN